MASVTSQQRLGSVISQRDMYFHEPRYRDYRWLETNAFTFTVPEAHLRCHIRAGFRSNLGVVETTMMVYSNPDPHAGQLGYDYMDQRHHVPMPPCNLDCYQLANGMSVKMTKPMQEWELRYEDGPETVVDLHLRGLTPPLHVNETGTDEAARATIRLGHLDQMMAVTGTARIRGKEYAVDWPAWRDHSWSPRPESSSGYGTPVSANFDYGSFGEDFSFFVQTRNEWEAIDRGVVHNGYILDGGEVLRLKHGEGRYVYDDQWVTTHLEYDLEDERGRSHRFIGTPRGFAHRGSVVLACVEWRTPDGQVGWGEYDWHGDYYKLKDTRPPLP